MFRRILMPILGRYSSPKMLVRLLGVYAGVEAPSSTLDVIAVDVISSVVSRVASRIGVDEDYLRGYLKEPYMRRGLASLLLGLLLYGVTKPQRITLHTWSYGILLRGVI